MTIRATDTFTDTSATRLDSHTATSGGVWANPTGFNVLQMPVISNANRARANHAGGAVAIAPGTATADNEFAECDAVTLTVADSFGIMARCNASGCRGYLLYFAGGNASILRLDNSSTFTAIGSGVAQTITVATRKIRIIVSGTGSTVTIKGDYNGTNILNVTDSSASRITTLGNGGIYFDTTNSDTTGTHLDNFNYYDASGAVTVTDLTARRVYQRIAGVLPSLTVAGTYVGTPTNIEAQVVTLSGNVVAAWATLASGPSGGTFSGSLSNIPQGGWFNIQVRFSNDTTTTNSGTNRWGVGDIISVAGQSNGLLYFQDAGAIIAGADFTAPDLVSQYTLAGGWALPTKNGACALGGIMSGATGLPVGIHNGAVDGSGMHTGTGTADWQSATAGKPLPLWKTDVTAMGGKLAAIIWIQGEADAGAGIATATYVTDATTLFAAFRSYTSQSTLPVIITMLGNTTDASWTDANGDKIRQAQVTLGGATSNAIGATTSDLGTYAGSPQVHFSATSYVKHARRNGMATLQALGYLTQSRGPQITGWRSVSSTQTDIELQHRLSTDFTPTSAITGFRILDSGTPVTISAAVRQTARSIRLTHTAIVGTRTADFGYGANPTITGWPLGNSAFVLPLEQMNPIPAGRTITLTLQNSPTDATVRASLSGLKCAFHPEATPDAFVGAPDDVATSMTTDGSGVFTWKVNTPLAAAAVGYLEIANTDGTTGQSPVSKVFSGPVALA